MNTILLFQLIIITLPCLTMGSIIYRTNNLDQTDNWNESEDDIILPEDESLSRRNHYSKLRETVSQTKRQTLNYYIDWDGYNSNNLPPNVEELIRNSWDIYEVYTGKTFVKTDDINNYDFYISFTTFDSKSVLGRAYIGSYPHEIYFTNSFSFINNVGRLFEVILHEMGHAMGLYHNMISESMMYPFVHGSNPICNLKWIDVMNMHKLFPKGDTFYTDEEKCFVTPDGRILDNPLFDENPKPNPTTTTTTTRKPSIPNTPRRRPSNNPENNPRRRPSNNPENNPRRRPSNNPRRRPSNNPTTTTRKPSIPNTPSYPTVNPGKNDRKSIIMRMVQNYYKQLNNEPDLFNIIYNQNQSSSSEESDNNDFNNAKNVYDFEHMSENVLDMSENLYTMYHFENLLESDKEDDKTFYNLFITINSWLFISFSLLFVILVITAIVLQY